LLGELVGDLEKPWIRRAPKLGLVSAVDIPIGLGSLSPMPRTMRVEYPGAICHVMDRGDRREDIFVDDVEALVDRTPKAKQADPAADVAALERELDERVYRLYGLTAEEIKIVEEIAK
jgi:hypothetical protein